MNGADLKTLMPETARFVAAAREAFGADLVNPAIRAAIHDGQPTFYARENGIEVGHREDIPEERRIKVSEMCIGSLKSVLEKNRQTNVVR